MILKNVRSIAHAPSMGKFWLLVTIFTVLSYQFAIIRTLCICTNFEGSPLGISGMYEKKFHDWILRLSLGEPIILNSIIVVDVVN